MKLKFTALALAVMACGSSMAVTPAANIAISSGASASKANFKLALVNRCPGQLAEFTLPFTPPATLNTNISTYVCAPAGSFANANAPTAAEYAAAGSTNFTGTTIAEVRYNVTNGSFTAVCLLAGWPTGTACPAADQYIDPATGALAASPTGSNVVGGLLDLEVNGFLSTVRAGINLPAGTSVISANFGQTFGVAVSNSLYNEMFTSQQNAGRLPAAGVCAVTDTNRPECVPVIGKAQIATIMSNTDNNAAQTRGANFLASTITTGTRLNYGRRIDTSGTQAVAQQYFLGNVCSPAANITVLPQPSPSPSATAGGNLFVYALGSTGNVRTLLNDVAQPYTVAIMSGENNQTGQTWKWVRVGGMHMAESAAPAQIAAPTNTSTALDGRYDFWYLSRVVRPNAAPAPAFWTSVIAGLGAVPAGNTPGLFRTNETTFTKGSTNSCLPAASN